MKNGKLIVPDYPTIGYIRGDGVGEDIFPQAKRVFDKNLWRKKENRLAKINGRRRSFRK